MTEPNTNGTPDVRDLARDQDIAARIARGETYAEVGRIHGLSRQRVHQIASRYPDAIESHRWVTHVRARARARERDARRRCQGCGKVRQPHAAYQGPLCLPCSAAARQKWTPVLIVARLQEWTERYGRPPSATDWNPTLTQGPRREEAIALYRDANGHWPPTSAVQERFGSWSAALAAAGLASNPPGYHGHRVAREGGAR